MFTPTLDDFETVGLIYEAANHPGLWPEVLDRVTPEVGAGGGTLILIDPHYRVADISHTTANYTPAQIHEWRMKYAQHERLDVLFAAPAGKIITDEDAWPDREAFWSNPLIQWRLRDTGLPHAFGCNLNNGEGWQDAVIFQCRETPCPSLGESTQRFLAFYPHFARSVRLSRLRSIVEAKYQRFLDVLDWLDIGMILLHDNSEVAFANEEARRIVESRGALTLKQRHLAAAAPSDHADLMAAISRALAASSKSEVTQGADRCVLRCPDRGEPCFVEVVPLREADFGSGAVLFIVDPLHEPTFRPEGLDRLYGLASAEMHICTMLVKGMTNPQMADERHVSPETIKTQIASVLDKTKRADRLELLRLIVKINPPLKRDS